VGAGDVVNLPCKRDGIVVQHFNDDSEKAAIFMRGAQSLCRHQRRPRLRLTSTRAVAGLPAAGGGVITMSEIERTRERERGTIPRRLRDLHRSDASSWNGRRPAKWW